MRHFSVHQRISVHELTSFSSYENCSHGNSGTAQTTIGKILRDRYGLKVVDLNEVIRAHQYYAGWDETRDDDS